MGIPVLQQSICGCNLRTGSRVIAWLSLLSAVMAIVLGVIELAGIRDYAEDLDKDVKLEFTAFTWITVIVSIFILFATLALLMGIDREKPLYMLPWICCKTFIVIVALILNIVAIVLIEISFVRVMSIIDQCASAYFILIVFSYYRSLKEEAPNYT